MTSSEVIAYLYAQTAANIHQLKTEAYKATTHEKYAYRAPEGKTFRNKRPDQQLMDAGWTYGKVRFERVASYMSPRHERWQEYRAAKRQATVLMAACLILKANNGGVPEKEEIGALVQTGLFRSQARTASAQKSLAYAAYRLLRKLDNRLRDQPGRFIAVAAWMNDREERQVANVQ